MCVFVVFVQMCARERVGACVLCVKTFNAALSAHRLLWELFYHAYTFFCDQSFLNTYVHTLSLFHIHTLSLSLSLSLSLEYPHTQAVGSVSMAYQCFKLSLTANNSHSEAYNNLGVIEWRRGRGEQVSVCVGGWVD